MRATDRELFARAVLVALTLLPSSAALASSEQNIEERVDEARAAPAPALHKGSWVVVPIPVANPTVGAGLQVAVLYLHPTKPSDEGAPNSTSGIGAMATDSRSWLIGAFHDGSYLSNRFRLSASVGAGGFKLTFFGIGDDPLPGGRSVPYEFEGVMGQLRGEARLPHVDHWFVGLTYLRQQSVVTFRTSELVPGLPDIPADIRSAALGPHLTYDSRDSNYFPSSGQYFRARWLNYAPLWGGDLTYDKTDVFYNHYAAPTSRAVIALRARLQSATDGTPFYDLPTLDMRGFSRDRYRDKNTVSLTAEGRYKFRPRWGMVAFVEAGRFAPSLGTLSDGRTITSWGGGVRWQVTAERDMHLGLDFAVSTDDRAVFIQVGERF